MLLERGDVANSWRRERWDSLRLLTPNWQTRLPGYRYDGADPDGFMTAAEVIEFVSRFAVAAAAPVRTHTTVTSVKQTDEGYHLATGRGDLRCRTLVLASGACNIPNVPPLQQGLPAFIECLTPFDYRNPNQLPEGRVLVVGASATGLQLAHEIHRSGRPVTLSVGEHVRLPRIYRGRDVLWWMNASGIWNQRYDEIDDLTRARRLPSPQLVGTPERATLDLNALSGVGVELVGRLAAVRNGRALFSGGLRNQFALAEARSGDEPDKVTARTRAFMEALDKALKARSADGAVVLVGEAIVASSGEDITAAVAADVAKLVPMPIAQAMPARLPVVVGAGSAVSSGGGVGQSMLSAYGPPGPPPSTPPGGGDQGALAGYPQGGPGQQNGPGQPGGGDPSAYQGGGNGQP